VPVPLGAPPQPAEVLPAEPASGRLEPHVVGIGRRFVVGVLCLVPATVGSRGRPSATPTACTITHVNGPTS
jgi:hypothetical protein